MCKIEIEDLCKFADEGLHETWRYTHLKLLSRCKFDYYLIIN